jgi:triosephosphate isomerase
MPRRRLIAANWKMNKAIAEAVAFVSPLRDALPKLGGVDLALFPSFFCVRPVSDELAGTTVAVGAQDMYHEKEGAFTGEVSGRMLRDAGATMVLIGHSERRHILGEQDEVVARKLGAALRDGLVPLLCVGETLAERDAGRARAVVESQLGAACDGLSPELARRVVIAYEPVWAIGTGRVASPKDAAEMHAAVRAWLLETFDTDLASHARVLYGGSVKPENASGLLASDDVDGFLIGGASLDPASYIGIAAAAAGQRPAG